MKFMIAMMPIRNPAKLTQPTPSSSLLCTGAVVIAALLGSETDGCADGAAQRDRAADPPVRHRPDRVMRGHAGCERNVHPKSGERSEMDTASARALAHQVHSGQR